jgi:hypothetical protein
LEQQLSGISNTLSSDVRGFEAGSVARNIFLLFLLQGIYATGEREGGSFLYLQCRIYQMAAAYEAG